MYQHINLSTRRNMKFIKLVSRSISVYLAILPLELFFPTAPTCCFIDTYLSNVIAILSLDFVIKDISCAWDFPRTIMHLLQGEWFIWFGDLSGFYIPYRYGL